MNNAPLNALRHHVTGAIERGEKEAIAEQRAPRLLITPDMNTLDCQYAQAIVDDLVAALQRALMTFGRFGGNYVAHESDPDGILRQRSSVFCPKGL